jgi:hypothetical protein
MLKFSSRGDATLSRRVVELFHQVSIDPLSFVFFFYFRKRGCPTRPPVPFPPSFRHFLILPVAQQAGIRSRLTTKDEPRGRDGRGFQGPGLDHGVFVPFRLMFGEEFHSVPIVQASIDGSMSPEGNWALGKAIAKLRCVAGRPVMQLEIFG